MGVAPYSLVFFQNYGQACIISRKGTMLTSFWHTLIPLWFRVKSPLEPWQSASLAKI